MGKKLKYFILGAAAFVGVAVFTASKNTDFALGKNIEILINMFRDVSFFYVDEVDADELLKDAAAGMTSSLDPYTEYMPAEDMEQFAMMTTGKYGGIGAIIRQKDDYVVIAEPYEGSPADKAGLVAGDKILEINGKSANNYTTEQVSSELKGDPGTNVRVKVERFFTGKQEQVTIRRERISIPAIPYHGFVADGVGYIKHTDFSEDCSADLRNALMELKKEGELRGLILDYRSNGGGIMQEAVKILSFFVPRGTEVVSMRGRSPQSVASYKTETWPIDTQTPIVVLVNGGSASAAEIVAGAMQDLDRGVLMGQRTFGKGLVQSTRPVGFNSYLKITTAKYYTPSGRCIQAVDYAHRDEDGNITNVPDSLIVEFATAAGRKVYDGGGVMPDVVLSPDFISSFTMVAYGKGYIYDFVDEYMRRYSGKVDPATFHLSDEQYGDFIAFMQDKDMKYESETSKALKLLRARAERELYSEKIGAELAALEQSLSDDTGRDLQLYRNQLAKVIESEIVARQHYQRGTILYELANDDEITKAVELLSDRSRYDTITTSEDTKRK